MTTYYEDATVQLHHGDCLDVLRSLPDASVDSMVTDPPYGLEFMGKEWDAPWKQGADVHAEARTMRADEMGDENKRRFIASSVNKYAAGLPFQQWCELWATECLRVLKPGGHLLAFGGTRTWHRLACAVEDAGFEVRDSIAWLYGSGFPKSLNVAKAIQSGGGRPEDIRRLAMGDDYTPSGRGRVNYDHGGGSAMNGTTDEIPLSDAARTWQGWGTALKPAFEPVVVARKPLSGTVVSNVLAWGTGALNVDATRIGANEWEHAGSLCASCAGDAAQSKRRTAPARPASTATKPAEESQSGRAATSPADTSRAATGCSDGTKAGGRSTSSSTARSGSSTTVPSLMATSSTTGTRTSSTTGSRTCTSCAGEITTPTTTSGSSAGRWPSNAVLDESQAAELDQQSGESVSPPVGSTCAPKPHKSGSMGGGIKLNAEPMENGYGDSGGASRFFYVAKADAGERVRVAGVAHPTVKPLALMRWLVRLVTPPGGTVLEPFAGSGTTVEACILEGFHCVAIEREADYLPLIVQRINRRRDPVAAVIAQGDDAGLFDLLDGEPA